MNLCDYYVHEVLSKPKQIVFSANNGTKFIWWDVGISYDYGNGELKHRKLSFDRKEHAETVEKGYRFTL